MMMMKRPKAIKSDFHGPTLLRNMKPHLSRGGVSPPLNATPGAWIHPLNKKDPTRAQNSQSKLSF